jgi:hypothetical protein
LTLASGFPARCGAWRGAGITEAFRVLRDRTGDPVKIVIVT